MQEFKEYKIENETLCCMTMLDDLRSNPNMQSSNYRFNFPVPFKRVEILQAAYAYVRKCYIAGKVATQVDFKTKMNMEAYKVIADSKSLERIFHILVTSEENLLNAEEKALYEQLYMSEPPRVVPAPKPVLIETLAKSHVSYAKPPTVLQSYSAVEKPTTMSKLTNKFNASSAFGKRPLLMNSVTKPVTAKPVAPVELPQPAIPTTVPKPVAAAMPPQKKGQFQYRKSVQSPLFSAKLPSIALPIENAILEDSDDVSSRAPAEPAIEPVPETVIPSTLPMLLDDASEIQWHTPTKSSGEKRAKEATSADEAVQSPKKKPKSQVEDKPASKDVVDDYLELLKAHQSPCKRKSDEAAEQAVPPVLHVPIQASVPPSVPKKVPQSSRMSSEERAAMRAKLTEEYKRYTDEYHKRMQELESSSDSEVYIVAKTSAIRQPDPSEIVDLSTQAAAPKPAKVIDLSLASQFTSPHAESTDESSSESL